MEKVCELANFGCSQIAVGMLRRTHPDTLIGQTSLLHTSQFSYFLPNIFVLFSRFLAHSSIFLSIYPTSHSIFLFTLASLIGLLAS